MTLLNDKEVQSFIKMQMLIIEVYFSNPLK